MATTDYFILSDSILSRTKRFKVVFGNYHGVLMKAESLEHTIDGHKDIARGAVYETHDYLILVPQESGDPNYGTLDDLKYFYSLNQPMGSPSDILTLTDHYGNMHLVAYTKEFDPQPLSVVIEGLDAKFLVHAVFEFLADVVGS